MDENEQLEWDESIQSEIEQARREQVEREAKKALDKKNKRKEVLQRFSYVAIVLVLVFVGFLLVRTFQNDNEQPATPAALTSEAEVESTNNEQPEAPTLEAEVKPTEALPSDQPDQTAISEEREERIEELEGLLEDSETANTKLIDQVELLEHEKMEQLAKIKQLEDQKKILSDEVEDLELDRLALNDELAQLEGVQGENDMLNTTVNSLKEQLAQFQEPKVEQIRAPTLDLNCFQTGIDNGEVDCRIYNFTDNSISFQLSLTQHNNEHNPFVNFENDEIEELLPLDVGEGDIDKNAVESGQYTVAPNTFLQRKIFVRCEDKLCPGVVSAEIAIVTDNSTVDGVKTIVHFPNP